VKKNGRYSERLCTQGIPRVLRRRATGLEAAWERVGSATTPREALRQVLDGDPLGIRARCERILRQEQERLGGRKDGHEDRCEPRQANEEQSRLESACACRGEVWIQAAARVAFDVLRERVLRCHAAAGVNEDTHEDNADRPRLAMVEREIDAWLDRRIERVLRELRPGAEEARHLPPAPRLSAS